ncbi:diacylglycerol kinase [Deinococcus ruber]|uniref:Diacylglycerol kinase n=1 Tax=Deinococcus ruber TaxID=1848197 RepID=A0A918FDI4_9DEIO|nr:diacylglycerol kinase [Deinococcus ruber]GGR30000.1 diacylglycerol kinase [Deinococcus ruber]
MRRWLLSAGFALRGVAHAWRTQPNFRIEVVLGLIALAFSLWLHAALPPILLSIGLVLGLELLNTALEAALDQLHPGRHPAIGAAKDAAAGAVLVASLCTLLVGAVELGPPLWAKLGL